MPCYFLFFFVSIRSGQWFWRALGLFWKLVVSVDTWPKLWPHRPLNPWQHMSVSWLPYVTWPNSSHQRTSLREHQCRCLTEMVWIHHLTYSHTSLKTHLTVLMRSRWWGRSIYCPPAADSSCLTWHVCIHLSTVSFNLLSYYIVCFYVEQLQALMLSRPVFI